MITALLCIAYLALAVALVATGMLCVFIWWAWKEDR